MWHLNELDMHGCARFQAATLTDYNPVSVGRARQYFDVIGSFKTEGHRPDLDLTVRIHYEERWIAALVTDSLQGNSYGIVLLFQHQRGFRVHTRNQRAAGVGHVHLGVHGARVLFDVHREARYFARKVPVQRRDPYRDRIADPYIAHVRLRYGNHQAEQIVFRELHQGEHIGG